MSTPFADLLYAWLPGIYRDKDATGNLAAFLQIAVGPLTDLETSIGQLLNDFYIDTARDAFIPLIAPLIGVQTDTGFPPSAQRFEAGTALDFYRQKGLASTASSQASQLTGMAVTTVDFSQSVAQIPFLTDVNPVIALRGQTIGESPAGSGNFFFRQDESLQPLFDETRGKPITRAAMSGNEANFAGVESAFDIRNRGVSIFATNAATTWVAVTADLTDFAHPKTASGAALTVAALQVAVDPELGRFLIVSPLPLAGNLTVNYHALAPASLILQTFDLRNPGAVQKIGRSDDSTPYTLDIRGSRSPSDGIGRTHFDNFGFYFTVGRVMANRLPNRLPGGPPDRFSFDDRPLATGDANGVTLQLLDGLDGRPLTRENLTGHAGDFFGARGFTIRARGISLNDPAFPVAITLRAADLSDFSNPKDAGGAAITPASADVLIDPQLARFLLTSTALGISPEQLRVDYLLGPAALISGAAPMPLLPAAELYAFDAGGADTALRDAFDGTAISSLLRLGVPLSQFDGTSRGWVLRRNGTPLALTGVIQDLTVAVPPVAAGQVALDPARGRFQIPPGILSAGDILTVDYTSEDPQATANTLSRVAQRTPRMMPAGVVPVIIDSRHTTVNPAVLP